MEGATYDTKNNMRTQKPSSRIYMLDGIFSADNNKNKTAQNIYYMPCLYSNIQHCIHISIYTLIHTHTHSQARTRTHINKYCSSDANDRGNQFYLHNSGMAQCLSSFFFDIVRVVSFSVANKITYSFELNASCKSASVYVYVCAPHMCAYYIHIDERYKLPTANIRW